MEHVGPVAVTELAAALGAAVRRPYARQVLVETVRAHGALEPAERAGLDLFAAGELPPGAEWGLARTLTELAGERPLLRRELRLWSFAAAAATGPVREVRNALDGSAHVSGHLFQAGFVHGDVHFHGDPGSAARVPRQLLPVSRHFTGRDPEVAALEAVLGGSAAGQVLVVISGPPGVGKTTLASHWLRGLADAYPDGQLYADLRGHGIGQEPAHPGEILGHFLRALGIDQVPVALGEQSALWRSVAAGRRLAVMLDNAVSAAQVRPLLPGAPGSLVGVTSRLRLTGLVGDGASFHPLEPLSKGSTLELLTQLVGVERVRREPDSARQVAVLCSGIPLAVCVAGARIVARPRQPLAALASALGMCAGPDTEGETGLRRARYSDGESHGLLAADEGAVRRALDASYVALSAELAAVYRRLGVLPVTVFGVQVAAVAAELPQGRMERALDELTESHLVEELSPKGRSGPARYRLHDLVRVHAAGLAARHGTAAELVACVRRVVDLLLAHATAAEALLTPSHRTMRRSCAVPPEQPAPFTRAQDALDWLDTERTHLMAALRAAVAHGWDDTVWQFADALWPLFLRLRPYGLWIEAHELGLAAARRSGDRAGESRMLTSGGTGLRNAGRYDEAAAWFEEARRGAVRDDDRRAEAQALHGLGQSHRLAGRLGEAVGYFRRALLLREELGYRRGAALTRICLGDVAIARGRPTEAIEPLTRARADLLAEQDAYDAARALAFLGSARSRGSQVAAAEDELRCALDEFETTGSGYWQARVLEMLGEIAEKHGDQARARELYEQSLARCAPVSEPDARRLAEHLRRTEEKPGVPAPEE